MVKSKRQSLGVWMNGYHIGKLNKSASGSLTFTYSESWLKTDGARPISLSLPLRSQVYSDERVYNFYDNLLTENHRIRDRVQIYFKIQTSHPFDLLAAIGQDCVGALHLLPEGKEPQDIKKAIGEPLDKAEVEKILLSFHQKTAHTPSPTKELHVSLAGTQEKIALLKLGSQWYRPLGATPTTHILKLPSRHYEDSGKEQNYNCENEWLCLKIASAFGLPVCQSEIVTFGSIKVLVIERFDRKSDASGWIMRLPQENICQALGLPPHLKYERDGGPSIADIFTLLKKSEQPQVDQEIFFRSLILLWLLAVTDGHAKNFSLFLLPYAGLRLTPLYNIVSAYPLIDKNQLKFEEIEMAMSVTDKNISTPWAYTKPHHFISTATQNGLDEQLARTIFQEMIDQVEDIIHEVTQEIPSDFPKFIIDSIFEGLKRKKKHALSLLKRG